jgi:hypothetical protein
LGEGQPLATACVVGLRSPTVIPGLVPGIQPTASADMCGKLDPGNKCRDDTLGKSIS